MKPEVRRIKDIGNRPATLLENEAVRVVVVDKGGMVPELSFRRQEGLCNTHWTPHFRSNSGEPYDPDRFGEYWPVELLYEAAGNFPCFPNFGAPCSTNGIEHPPHGLTANGPWTIVQWGSTPDAAVYQKSTIGPTLAYPSYPISYTKFDVLLPGHPIHYVQIRAKNTGNETLKINAAWHNTIGPPFLSAGCIIDASADRFASPPSPSEFDDTGRILPGTEFEGLDSAPLRGGGKASLREVPGMIGFTDLVVGSVPRDADIGWISVVNPLIDAVYLTYFKGPSKVSPSDIPLNFNCLWMQYGGRNFPPWANAQGGTDITFCLGTENATGAYANGLAYSLEHEEVLGHPTTVSIEPGEEKVQLYATLAAEYDGLKLSVGIDGVEENKEGITLIGKNGSGSFDVMADPEFSALTKIVETL